MVKVAVDVRVRFTCMAVDPSSAPSSTELESGRSSKNFHHCSNCPNETRHEMRSSKVFQAKFLVLIVLFLFLLHVIERCGGG